MLCVACQLGDTLAICQVLVVIQWKGESVGDLVALPPDLLCCDRAFLVGLKGV